MYQVEKPLLDQKVSHLNAGAGLVLGLNHLVRNISIPARKVPHLPEGPPFLGFSRQELEWVAIAFSTSITKEPQSLISQAVRVTGKLLGLRG